MLRVLASDLDKIYQILMVKTYVQECLIFHPKFTEAQSFKLGCESTPSSRFNVAEAPSMISGAINLR